MMKKQKEWLIIFSCLLVMVGCGKDTITTIDAESDTNIEKSTVDERVTEGLRAVNVGDKETILDEELVLTFIDEFDGTSLKTDLWEYCPSWERADRGGKWDSKCVAVDNDKLVLSVIYDEDAGCYKSGAIRTKGLFEQTYGYFEASMRVQDVPGFWSAFWMMCGEVGNIDGYGNDGTEIDIMEAYNYESKGINFALHWDGYEKDHQSVGKSKEYPDLYDGNFHTYAVLWTPTEYKWYIDGEFVWKSKAGGVCDNPGYMKLTLEVGSWAGEIVPSDLPATVEVEYVRAYQFSDRLE